MLAYVYIMTNDRRTVLYIGCAEDLVKRVYLHRNGLLGGFTKKYNVKNLVYFDECRNMIIARAKERSLKASPRAKKVNLIDARNPLWTDLYQQVKIQSAECCIQDKIMAPSPVTI